MDKTDRLRDYGLAFLLYEHGLGVCGYELIRELFIFIKLILNSYLEYQSYKTCTEYPVRMSIAKAKGYLTPPYIFGDSSYTELLCKEDCIFCHCPFYARNLFDELRHNHRTDYDEWVMEYFKDFK